jgi:hypothetical protein
MAKHAKHTVHGTILYPIRHPKKVVKGVAKAVVKVVKHL